MASSSVSERYQKTLAKLRQLSESGILIVVEGKRDEAKLRELEITGPIQKIQGTRLFELVEAFPKEVIILTDFDPEGARLSRDLKIQCEHNGVKANTQLRVDLFSNTFSRKVEELTSSSREESS